MNVLRGIGGSSPQILRGGHGPMVSALVRAYNGGLGACRQQGIGTVPGQWSPWNWSTFRFWTFNGSCEFAHFFWNMEVQRNQIVV